MDDIMMASLKVSRDLITVTLATADEQGITMENQMKWMKLYHDISKVIGYPEHDGL